MIRLVKYLIAAQTAGVQCGGQFGIWASANAFPGE